MNKTEALNIGIASPAHRTNNTIQTAFSKAMMKKIENLPSEMHPAYLASTSKRSIQLWQWIAVGLFMIAGFCFLPLSTIGRWGFAVGAFFIVPLALMYALIIIAFVAFFVTQNIDFLSKIFDYNDKNKKLFSRK